METIREVLDWAEGLATRHGKEDSAVKLLLMYVTKRESYEILASLDEKLSEVEIGQFKDYVEKYVHDGVPVQHLMGYETFFGYDFKVNEDVLIPRFETEELVAKVLDVYSDYFDGECVDVVDVGCGSGAIGITLRLEEPNMKVTLTDISDAALNVSRTNAEALGAEVDFLQSDMLGTLMEQGRKFDFLVSNPPYIPTVEEVDPLVLDNEPHLALFGGTDGLRFYREILSGAATILKDRSVIAFEHAYSHREAMAGLVREYFPDSEFETFKDMNGRDRMTVVKNF